MMYRQIQAEEESKIPERDEKELSEAFRLFDLNGDGFIEWEELKVLIFVENQFVVVFEKVSLIFSTKSFVCKFKADLLDLVLPNPNCT